MSAAMGTAVSYAGAGATFGPWGAVAGAVVGLVVGLMADDDAAEQQQKLVDARIEEAKAKNKLNLQEAARNAGEINRQRSMAYIQTAQSLQHMQEEGSVATAQANVMIAAADAIGNSTKAVKSDIDHQMNEARAQINFNSEVQEENLNVSLIQMINQAKSNFAKVSADGLISTAGSGSIFGQALVSGMAGLSEYRKAGGSLPWDATPKAATSSIGG